MTGKTMGNSVMKKRAMMDKMMKTVGFLAVTLLLILTCVLCVAGTVKSRTEFADAELEQYFKEKEKYLLVDTRDYLNEKGFKNSGITLTRVVEKPGERAYTMTIHHGKIDRMSDTEREALQTSLECFNKEPEHCTLEYEFLLE